MPFSSITAYIKQLHGKDKPKAVEAAVKAWKVFGKAAETGTTDLVAVPLTTLIGLNLGLKNTATRPAASIVLESFTSMGMDSLVVSLQRQEDQ